jgi:PKD domain-containing protein
MRHRKWPRTAVLVASVWCITMAACGCEDNTRQSEGSGVGARLPSPVVPRHVRPEEPVATDRPVSTPLPSPDLVTEATRSAPDLTVQIDAEPDIGRAPLNVHFEALVGGDGDSLQYQWDFGDGGSDDQNPTTHKYAAPGAYTATLTVTDAAGRTGREQAGIQVDPSDAAEGDLR